MRPSRSRTQQIQPSFSTHIARSAGAAPPSSACTCRFRRHCDGARKSSSSCGGVKRGGYDETLRVELSRRTRNYIGDALQPACRCAGVMRLQTKSSRACWLHVCVRFLTNSALQPVFAQCVFHMPRIRAREGILHSPRCVPRCARFAEQQPTEPFGLTFATCACLYLSNTARSEQVLRPTCDDARVRPLRMRSLHMRMRSVFCCFVRLRLALLPIFCLCSPCISRCSYDDSEYDAPLWLRWCVFLGAKLLAHFNSNTPPQFVLCALDDDDVNMCGCSSRVARVVRTTISKTHSR